MERILGCFDGRFSAVGGKLTKFSLGHSGVCQAALGLILLLVWGMTASAATFYIDYAAGLDSNNGTSKASPWKRHPYMQGFSGTYQHIGGDRFIFKGGTTWPVTCFQLRISAGGVSDSNRDYYGTDQTWYSGPAFTRALFDFQDTKIGSGFAGSGVHITSGYIYFGDGLELARHRADSVYGGMTISAYGSVNYLKLTNCIVRDWSLATPVAAGQDGGGGIGYFGGGGGNSLEVDHCTFHQVNSGTINGTAVANIGTCKFSEVYHTASAFHGGGIVHDNAFHDLMDTSDASQHTDAIITFSPSTIYNNLIYNLVGRCAPIELSAPSSGSVNGYDTVYNNIVYNCGAQTPLWTKVDNGNYASYGLIAYDNLLEHGSSWCIIVEAGYNGAVFGFLDLHDNVLITTTTAILYGNSSGMADVTAVTNYNNSVSGSLPGYGPSNNYNPTGARGPSGSVGAAGASTQSAVNPLIPSASIVLNSPTADSVISGTLTMSATVGSSGAAITTVQFLVDGIQVANATSSGSTYLASWDSHLVANGVHSITVMTADSLGEQSSSSISSVTISNNAPTNPSTPGGATPISWTWPAATGKVDSPFVVATNASGTYVVQTIATGPNDGGKLTFSFDAPSLGFYSVSATFNTSDQNHNSIYVDMDIDPAATEASVWDLPVTGGLWQTAYASWRGTGDNSTRQIPIKTWSLMPGPHTLTLSGREANTMLRQVSVVKVPAAPTSLRIAANPF